MTLELYSVALSIALMLLLAATLLALTLSATSSSFRRRFDAIPYRTYMGCMALLAGAAVIGAFVYQLLYLTPVCELCWWQRIFLFPTVAIAGVAWWTRSRKAHITVAILSALGLFYALYHYYYHFEGLVLGNAVSLPCTSGGLLPACTESAILTFGFITIPLMGAVVFIALLAASYLAGRSESREQGS